MKLPEENMSNENNTETVEGEIIKEYDIKEYTSDIRQAVESDIHIRGLDPGHYKLVKTE